MKKQLTSKYIFDLLGILLIINIERANLEQLRDAKPQFYWEYFVSISPLHFNPFLIGGWAAEVFHTEYTAFFLGKQKTNDGEFSYLWKSEWPHCSEERWYKMKKKSFVVSIVSSINHLEDTVPAGNCLA